MTTPVAILLFAGFVAAGLAASLGPRRGLGTRRRLVDLLLAVALAASCFAGFTQWELWPFSAWPLMAMAEPPVVTHTRIVAVDDTGAEHAVDYRAWQPLSFDELMPWIDQEFPRLSATHQDDAALYLLLKAEEGRARARAGGSPGNLNRFLGPLAATYFLQHPKPWSDPANVPPAPFTGLRIYRETWNLEERAAGGPLMSRVLVYQYPRPEHE